MKKFYLKPEAVQIRLTAENMLAGSAFGGTGDDIIIQSTHDERDQYASPWDKNPIEEENKATWK